jgi:hypothetical protein
VRCYLQYPVDPFLSEDGSSWPLVVQLNVHGGSFREHCILLTQVASCMHGCVRDHGPVRSVVAIYKLAMVCVDAENRDSQIMSKYLYPFLP